MTLHDAIKQVLQEHGGVLTAEEIERKIAKDKLFIRPKDGELPEAKQIVFRVQNHLDEYEVIVRLRGYRSQ